MANRHALLIGVPRYDDEKFNDPRLAEAVRQDIDAMDAALSRSGYLITRRGTGTGHDAATLNQVNRAVEDACATVPPGGVLLIYFSGHGMAVDGRDYLVPSDAYRRPAGQAPAGGRSGPEPAALRPAPRSLVPVVPAEDVLSTCRAGLVVCLVDACRDEQTAPPPTAEPGGWQPGLADGGEFVLVMGCGAGQVCQYDETGSAFTQALTKVLDARNPARTLADVIGAVTRDMERRSRQSQGAAQVPVVRFRGISEAVGRIPVCDGDERAAAWRKAVGKSPLLALCLDRDLIHETVAECARRCGDAADTLRARTGLTDPWTDQDYPVRVLRITESLLRHAGLLPDSDHAPPGTAPRPDEAALLITAPFLREAVLAVGIRDAAGIDPANFARTYTPGARGDLELTHEMHQHLVRRAAGLADHGQASDQLALWLVHRWLTGRTRLWDEPGARDVYDLARPLITHCPGGADGGELPLVVQALLLAVAADPSDARLAAKLGKAYMDGWRFAAAVLRLAGIMAVDLRRLPPVVSDLVGTRMELQLTDVLDAAGRLAAWDWDGEAGTLDLRLVCEHPAMHEVFEEVVGRVVRASETVATSLGLPADMLARLPRRFTATGLRPKTIRSADDREETSYEVPLSRFQVAEEKVRELLMGRQLYGDPKLAIRELYQNALDACRWRATRQEYLTRRHRSPAPWTGLIRFTRGNDDGRPFLECEDNGVGMDAATLKHVFANAGERFVYGREFRAEQADWADLKPPLRMVSNSQFGVGVFSYFMLADEITVTTRHQHRDGVADPQAYEVRIASSGSLLQIKPAAGALPAGGTRVRLYLNADAARIPVAGTLREFLWVADYRVEATAPDGPETWEPGELRYGSEGVEPLKCGDDFWWVAGKGGLAADGIKTDLEIFGLVANLRGEHRPQFTVDRTTLRSWDGQWVDSQVSASLLDLTEWPGFTLSWLWHVANDDCGRAQHIFEHALAADQQIRVEGESGRMTSVPLEVAGCVPSDSGLFGHYGSGRETHWLVVWRAAVWRDLGHSTRIAGERVTPRRTDGFPVPGPIDGVLIDKVAGRRFDSSGRPHTKDFAAALAATGCTARSALRRLRRYAITGLDLSRVRHLSAVDHSTGHEDLTLLARIARWPSLAESRNRRFVYDVISTAGHLKQPVRDVARRAQELAENHWPGLAPDLTVLVACTDRIVEMLGPSVVPQWLGYDPSLRDVAEEARKLGWPIHKLLELCDDLVPLGVTVTGRNAFPREVNDIELRALRHVGPDGRSLTPLGLARIASEVGEPVALVHDTLARLEERGFLTRPALPDPADFIPPQRWIDFIDNRTVPLLRTRGRAGPLTGAPLSCQ